MSVRINYCNEPGCNNCSKASLKCKSCRYRLERYGNTKSGKYTRKLLKDKRIISKGEISNLELSQNKYAIVDTSLLGEITKVNWILNSAGYAYSSKLKKTMHSMIITANRGLFVDHINGNKLDNRLANLRVVTPQQNSFNSKWRHYSYDKKRNKYYSQIKIGDKRSFLGYYDTPEEALEAYKKVALLKQGEHSFYNR